MSICKSCDPPKVKISDCELCYQFSIDHQGRVIYLPDTVYQNGILIDLEQFTAGPCKCNTGVKVNELRITKACCAKKNVKVDKCGVVIFTTNPNGKQVSLPKTVCWRGQLLDFSSKEKLIPTPAKPITKKDCDTCKHEIPVDKCGLACYGVSTSRKEVYLPHSLCWNGIDIDLTS